MLLTMKYEHFKRWKGLFIFLAAFAVVELGILIGIFLRKQDSFLVGWFLLGFVSLAAVAYLQLGSIAIYSRELQEKSGYLVFMTPVSSYRILGGKMLYSILASASVGLIAGLLQIINYQIMTPVFHLDSLIDLADVVLLRYNTSFGTILAIIGALAAWFFLECVFLLSLGYLSASVGVTLFRNVKFKKPLISIIYLSLWLIMNFIRDKIPRIGDIAVDAGIGEILRADLPGLCFLAVVATAAWLASAYMMEKSISL